MRKGELRTSGIDREYPYQVAMPADRCAGAQYDVIHGFCAELGLSLAPRPHSFNEKDVWHVVYCFAIEMDADNFAARFGGRRMSPETRSKWGGRRH